MLRRLLLAVAAVVVTVPLGACGSCASTMAGAPDGGGGDAEPGGDREPSATQSCQTYAAAFCRRIEACTPFLLQLAYGDEVTCAQRAVKGCMPALSAAGSKVTPSLMVACAGAIDAQSCDEALDNPQPSACDLPGALPMFAACGASSQCVSGYCKMTGVCGTCAPHVGATARCDVDSDCSATLVCHLGTCVGPGILGAPCGVGSPCLRTLACIGGKCAAPVPVGGACSALTDCDGAHGGYCNLKAKLCEKTQITSTGLPCGLVATDGGTIAVACAAGESCGNLSPRGQGTCHNTAADGAPCGPDIACLPPAVCSPTARCTLPNPAFCHASAPPAD